jgi:hypothetical protein
MQAVLDLSTNLALVMILSLLMLLIVGNIIGFIGNCWSLGRIWVSLILS